MTVPALRAQMWIDGELVRDEPITMSNVDNWIGPEHAALCAQAEAQGQPWLVQISDPDNEMDGLPLRFGSDRAGMVDPIPVDLDTLPDAIEEQRGWRLP